MKGLALNVIWGLIIAISGMLVFLFLVTGTFRSAANWFYCNVYWKVASFFREEVSIPEVCKGLRRVYAKLERIDETNNELFSRKLLAYIIACWKDAEMRGIYESHPCYELRLPGGVENVSEEDVTRILLKEDRCTSIENFPVCGARDQIVWSVEGGLINDQRILLIEYNGEEQAVEVIG